MHVYPHDRTAFTQGLEFRGGFLYEGTGLEGRSTLRKVNLETGQVVEEIRIAPQLFGEGITVINQQILELTWKAEAGFVYDQDSFRAAAHVPLSRRRLGPGQRRIANLYERWQRRRSACGIR